MRGCLMLGVVLVIASLMFIVNGVIVGMVYAQIAQGGPKWLQQPKVIQIMMFTAPLGLLAVQWWVFDLISNWVSRFTRRRTT